MRLTTLSQTIVLLTFLIFSYTTFAQPNKENTELRKVLDAYYEESLILNPIAATYIGDNRFNDQLPNTIAVPYLKKVHDYNIKYKNLLATFKQANLSLSDRISLAIANDQIEQSLALEKFHLEYMPFDQGFRSLPANLPSFGSGTGIQPFKTIQDYDNWLKRLSAFSEWADTAIANFNKGIAVDMVLPKTLVVKIIPQLEAHTTTDTTSNIFYGPVLNLPASFTNAEKEVIRQKYSSALVNIVIPTYQKLAEYLKNVYLPKARTTSGYNSLPNGAAIYQALIRYYTTTTQTPEQIYQTGLQEVERITKAIDTLKSKVGFNGSTTDLFAFIGTDKQFFPFTTEEQVLDSFRAILPRIQANLKKLFNIVPKSAFEIKAIEKFKVASTSSNYQPGSEDGTRPGFFNVRIRDATRYNASTMESLFSHEAIPGHHFQASLQMENKHLPKIRRYARYPAFHEGWALYTESLGEELGLYTNPYAKISALGSELFRAARLVVDVGLHTGKMTREEAIQYMLKTAGVGANGASEVERYMGDPGQALAYKTGELKIKELKEKYQKSLGAKFDIRSFHDAILLGGAMPLNLLETYMDEWAKSQKGERTTAALKNNG